MDGAAPVDMVGEGFGYWLLKTDMIKPFDLYGFKIFPLSGGEMLERTDPASLLREEGPHGLSTAFDLNSFVWTDGDWKGVDLKEFII